VLYGRVEAGLRGRGVAVARAFVGNLFTSLDMMGATLTVMRLDPDLERWLAAPAASPGLRVGP
jgi:dihydroxyacetone kinase-like protein